MVLQTRVSTQAFPAKHGLENRKDWATTAAAVFEVMHI